MRIWIPILMAFAFAPCALPGLAPDRATANGRVLDAAGRPLENATVIVYSAGVKKGYSLFCPTCYRDCGKRTVTGPEGNYSINGLDTELSFTFVAVKDGYFATYISNVDPAVGPAPDANLKLKPAINDVSRIVRGRVVDADGEPLRWAVVQPDIAAYRDPAGHISLSAPFDWINEVTVTNDKGEFEIAFNQPAVEITFRVTARSMAPKHFTFPTGGERKTAVLTEGALVRGRLLYNGKPVPSAEVRLVPHDAGVGRWYPEVRIGTAEDGTFSITNVPPGRIWLLHPTMESLASRGLGADLIVCETKADGQEINLGDVNLKLAHTLRGKVVLVDAKRIPPEMRVTITTDRSADSQIVKIDPDGQFVFDGLPDGIYSLTPAIRGYRLLNECTNSLCRSVEIAIHGNVSDLAIKMAPEPEKESRP